MAKTELNTGNVALILVGLPARGKTFVSRNLSKYLRWIGIKTRTFSVAHYRRKLVGLQMRHEFFDPFNPTIMAERIRIANIALDEMCEWFTVPNQVAIYDAANITKQRREDIKAILLLRNVHCVFIECLCDDPQLILRDIDDTIKFSPDYVGVDHEIAVKDMQRRIEHYENVYESIQDPDESYIKMINHGDKVIMNNCKSYLQSKILYYLLNVNQFKHAIYMCASGGGLVKRAYKEDSSLQPAEEEFAKHLHEYIERNGSREIRVIFVY